MKINITRDENGRIIGFVASSESSDGHLTKEEHDLVREFLAEDSKTEQKKIEEDSKARQKMYEESTAKHKEWAGATGAIIKGFCEAIVDYLEEKEIRDTAKPKEQKFDKTVDRLDLTGPKDEESKPQIEQKNPKPVPNPDRDAYYAQNGNKFS